MTARLDRPAATNLRSSREDEKHNIWLRRRGLQRNRAHDTQADHKAANTTMYQPNWCRKNDLTINRPHASKPTPNEPGMQGSKAERRPMGWRHHDVPRPPTTTPTNAPEGRDSTIMQLTNQPQRTTSDPRPPGRAQARQSQEAWVRVTACQSRSTCLFKSSHAY